MDESTPKGPVRERQRDRGWSRNPVPQRGGKEMLSTPITRITTLLRRAGTMAAVAAIPLAVAAAPASAKPRLKAQEVKTCKLEVGNTTYEYGEGAKVTITSPLDGSKDTYTCKEGKWVKAAMLEVSGTVVSPVGALLEP